MATTTISINLAVMAEITPDFCAGLAADLIASTNPSAIGARKIQEALIAKRAGTPEIPFASRPDNVVPGLYISNIFTSAAFVGGQLNEKNSVGITHILSIHHGKPDETELLRPDAGCTIQFKTISLSDRAYANFLEHFPEIIRFIHTALQKPDAKVLVHCFAGVSRSATAVVAYLMWSRHMEWDQALRLLQRKRPIVNPNEGFQMQLQLWQGLDCCLVEDEATEKLEYTTTRIERGWKHYYKRGKPDLTALVGIERPKKQCQQLNGTNGPQQQREQDNEEQERDSGVRDSYWWELSSGV